jgi:hypothetical protein
MKAEAWCKRAADQITLSLGCPLVQPGEPLKITRQGFITACKKTQIRRKSWSSKLGKLGEEMNTCLTCQMGKSINDSKTFRAPKWVKFCSLAQLMDKR